MSSLPKLPPNLFSIPWVDPKTGVPTQQGQQMLRDLFTGVIGVTTPQGAIKPTAPILGRTEGVGTTLKNIDDGGVITAPGLDLSRDYVNKNIDNIPDGAAYQRTTPNDVLGSIRAYNALDTNNRLASTFNQTSVNTSNTPLGATSLSNDGTTTAITIAAGQNRFAPTAISYNAGSVDPGAFGTFYVYADDPNYLGGAVTYQFTTDLTVLNAAEGRVNFGGIKTTSGTPQTGGGQTGGSSGSGGSGGRGNRGL